MTTIRIGSRSNKPQPPPTTNLDNQEDTENEINQNPTKPSKKLRDKDADYPEDEDTQGQPSKKDREKMTSGDDGQPSVVTVVNTRRTSASDRHEDENNNNAPPPVKEKPRSRSMSTGDPKMNGHVDEDLEASLAYLKSLPKDGLKQSNLLDSLMQSYLAPRPKSAKELPPMKKTADNVAKEKPKSPSIGENQTAYEKLEELTGKRSRQTPPPNRMNDPSEFRSWVDPREHQRVKIKPKQWPPPRGPDDSGAYIVESYGQTDPYSKRLIKNIQKEKRLELEQKEKEKRSEIQTDNIKPVSKLRNTFTHKPKKPAPGVRKPETNVTGDREWIKHEKKPVEYDAPPDEPDWMNLIRNRRWRSTVKARFPCQKADVYEFERRSTTPKNWKRLAKDKTALKMLSEIVGMGAEGEELFMRLASQRQKMEEEQAEIDRRAEEELMAYEVARESMGDDVAYSLQMDAPLPSARMKQIPTRKDSDSESVGSVPSTAGSAYPFTTSQLEAAFLTNQLLKLHPEEFRKLMSLEKSRQAALRWQFSADPFDSVHEHQYLPYEIALLASEEPRVQQAMKKLLAQSDDYSTVFSSNSATPRGRRTRSEGFRTPGGGHESDYDGYESATSTTSEDVGRSRKKKRVPPPVKPRGRSVSPSMMRRKPMPSPTYLDAQGNLRVPDELQKGQRRRTLAEDLDDDRELHAHGLLSDADLQLGEELANLQQMTRDIGREVEEDLRKIELSMEDKKQRFMEEAKRNDSFEYGKQELDGIDKGEISSRRENFKDIERRSTTPSDTRADEVPKARQKVRRISSDAQLHEVFGKRREVSDAAQEQNGDDGSNVADTKQEMSELLNDINKTYGEHGE